MALSLSFASLARFVVVGDPWPCPNPSVYMLCPAAEFLFGVSHSDGSYVVGRALCAHCVRQYRVDGDATAAAEVGNSARVKEFWPCTLTVSAGVIFVGGCVVMITGDTVGVSDVVPTVELLVKVHGADTVTVVGG